MRYKYNNNLIIINNKKLKQMCYYSDIKLNTHVIIKIYRKTFIRILYAT